MSDILAVLLRFLSSAGVLSLFLACFTGFGSLLFRGQRPLQVRAASGMVVCYVAVSLLGFLGLLASWTLWLVLGTGLLSFLSAAMVRSGREAAPEEWREVRTALLTLVLLIPLASLAPSSRDAMNHHLMLPRLWLESGSLQRPDWCFFFSYPHLGESLYTLLGGTVGFGFSRVMSLLPFLLTAMAISRRIGNRLVRVLSIALLLSIPEAVRNATWAYVDSYVVLFAVLAFLEIRRADRAKREGGAADGDPGVTAPLLWGAAAASAKYNGLIVLGVVFVWALTGRGDSRSRTGARSLARGVVGSIAICSLWLIPNLLQWGNPVYPLFRSVLGPASQLGQRAAELVELLRAYTSSVRGIEDLILLPVAVSINGRWDDPRRFDGSSGPLLLFGVLLCLLLAWKRQRLLLVLSLAYLVPAVLLTVPDLRVRYLLPGLCPLVLPASTGIREGLRRRGVVRVATAIALAAGLAWSGYWIAVLYGAEQPFTYAGRQDEYLSENHAGYDFLLLSRDYVSSGRQGSDGADTLLLLNMGNRGFYAPGLPVYDSHNFPFRVLEPLWSGASSEELLSTLRGTGIDYIALDLDIAEQNIVPQLTDSELEQWREFLGSCTDLVVSSGPYVLLRLQE